MNAPIPAPFPALSVEDIAAHAYAIQRVCDAVNPNTVEQLPPWDGQENGNHKVGPVARAYSHLTAGDGDSIEHLVDWEQGNNGMVKPEVTPALYGNVAFQAACIKMKHLWDKQPPQPT